MRQLSGMDVSFLNMETRSTFGHVSSLNLFDVAGLRRRRLLRGDRAARRRSPRPAAAVPASARRGAARPRPAVLDRGPRLRPRLPRAPPRRAAAWHAAAAQRGRQPHPRPPARPGPAAVGAVRHRRHRRGSHLGHVHQGAPRHDRRCGRSVDARRRCSTSTRSGRPDAEPVPWQPEARAERHPAPASARSSSTSSAPRSSCVFRCVRSRELGGGDPQRWNCG